MGLETFTQPLEITLSPPGVWSRCLESTTPQRPGLGLRCFSTAQHSTALHCCRAAQSTFLLLPRPYLLPVRSTTTTSIIHLNYRHHFASTLALLRRPTLSASFSSPPRRVLASVILMLQPRMLFSSSVIVQHRFITTTTQLLSSPSAQPELGASSLGRHANTSPSLLRILS